jgi:hypothetical protein
MGNHTIEYVPEKRNQVTGNLWSVFEPSQGFGPREEIMQNSLASWSAAASRARRRFRPTFLLQNALMFQRSWPSESGVTATALQDASRISGLCSLPTIC